MLASLVTSFTIIIAALQLVQNNEETRRIMRSLEISSDAQNLISRSNQIELLFDGYMASFVRELEAGIELWQVKASSMHGMRNILESKWRAASTGNSQFQQYLDAISIDEPSSTPEQAAFRKAADALIHELELMGVKCLTGAVPAGVLLAEMGGHWAFQWLLCSPWVRQTWNRSSNSKFMVESADSKVAIHFSRRYGFWLAIMSALYSIKEWPDGEYASWGRKLLDQEFCGSLEAAQ